MTTETFVRTVKRSLASTPNIQWNSVTDSRLRALGRSFGQQELTPEEVLASLRTLFPLAAIRRPEAEVLLKNLR